MEISPLPDGPVPDPLLLSDGTRISTADQWRERRRPELMRLFETQEYGRCPEPPPLRHEPDADDTPVFGGAAIARQVAVHLTPSEGPKLHLLLVLPKDRPARVPVLLGLNFRGNHATTTERAVRLPDIWIPKEYAPENRATDALRGTGSHYWPMAVALLQGWAVATVYHGDMDPDRDDFTDGVHPHYYAPGQTRPADDEWGTLAAWAWGLSRALDYLRSDSDVDGSRVVVFGHSRNGKAALLAASGDQRFAGCISNQSGCGGAAIFRNKVGERIKDINIRFPHWFCGNFKQYNEREAELPFDQHELIATIAPRPVLVCSAAEDTWADPASELAALRAADPVYRLLGADGLGPDATASDAPLNTLLGRTLSYHRRPGAHAVNVADWEVFLRFVTKQVPAR